MQFQQALEHVRMFLKGLQCATLQPGTTIEQEHQARHQERTQGQPAMLLFIASQIAGAQAICQYHRLAEGEAETFTGDCVHRSRRISDQSHVAAADALQLAGGGQCAFLSRRNISPFEPRLQFREPLQGFCQSQFRVTRNQGDTNLISRNRRDVDLSVASPVEFHAVGPWRHAIMLPKRIAALPLTKSVEPGPTPASRVATGGTNNAARVYLATSQVNPIL